MTLLSGSLIFYALGEPRYLVLLLLSVLVNYFFGLFLVQGMSRQTENVSGNVSAHPGYGGQKITYTEDKGKRKSKNYQNKVKPNKKRRVIFAVAILFNVGLLVHFKYGMGRVYLPVGISFYTFQSMSYLADVYKGGQKREVSFLRFASYITMFPQLLSGPIVNYGEVREALSERSFTLKELQEGFKVFTMGLASKVLLADRIGLLWQEVQVTGFESISTPLAWMAAVAYSLKIYFDFYGYSLMAVGLGKMLGFELPENFRDPYMATSVRDFYRRWHATLGRWFRQYVYIPLGGNRRGGFRTVCNLLAVWLLTAMWHGNTPNFLIWGMILWLAIVIERQAEALGVFRFLKKGVWRILPHIYVWVLIPMTWVCFAVTDIEQIEIYLGRMFQVIPGINVSAGDWMNALKNYGVLFGAGIIACTPAVRKLFHRFKGTIPGMLLLAALFWFCVWRLEVEGQNPFMYLRF